MPEKKRPDFQAINPKKIAHAVHFWTPASKSEQDETPIFPLKKPLATEVAACHFSPLHLEKNVCLFLGVEKTTATQ